jgi:CRP-like cAMP-binding protein/SAM-dependent methyltransferase
MIPLFQLLDDKSVDWVINNSTEHRIDANEVLIREGTQIGSMYIVTEGLLGAYASGKQIGIAGPGTVVGEMSFVDQDPTAASMVALEQTHLLELSRDKVAVHVADDPLFAADFFRAIAVTLSQRLRVLSQNRTGRTFTRADAERAFDSDDWRSALSAMGEFKRMLVAADHESIKADGVSEETYQKLAAKSNELQQLSYRLLGDSSPLTPYMKEQLGGLLQTELLPYVLLTATIERCYSKPRGYAGDYLTIEKIYNNKPEGAGRIGAVVDRLFLEMPAAVAVRNRRGLLAEEILKTVNGRPDPARPARVLSLACGPAREIADVFAVLPDRNQLVATCLDIDLQALAFVADWRDKAGLKSRIHLLNQNLISLALGRAKLEVAPQELVYSIGLIDYFDDRMVIKMLDFIYEVLAPGGRVILGNFHPRNQTRALMDYLLEWRLIHRTEADMDRLFAGSKFKAPATSTRFEATGVNLFSECVKTGL